MGYYKLDEHNMPVKATFEETQEIWKNGRRVAEDTINGARVSTVFLVLDHGHGVGKPVLWETMVFGGKYDEYQERYTSYEDAVAGHKGMVARLSALN